LKLKRYWRKKRQALSSLRPAQHELSSFARSEHQRECFAIFGPQLLILIDRVRDDALQIAEG
jgi:hypothetical protein